MIQNSIQISFLIPLFLFSFGLSDDLTVTHNTETDIEVPSRYSVTISAGELNREETVVSFNLYHEFEPGIYLMKRDGEEPVKVQVDHRNKAWFILNELRAGNSKTWILENIRYPENKFASGDNGVKKRIDNNTISFQANGKEVLSYYHRDNEPPAGIEERFQRGGYIHPVYSPKGVRLTNHMNTPGHTHHYGIWSAWTRTEFQGRTPGFWSMNLNSGRVEQEDSLIIAWQGPVHGGFQARKHSIDVSALTPVVALNEQWEVYVYNVNDNQNYLIFDIETIQTANTSSPVLLTQHRYGGMSFRGHEDWNDTDKSFFLTSEGLDRQNGHGTRARWCHIGGYSEGNLAGITIMDHPENFRFPQPMRINPNHPFFNYAPVQLGDMTIEPGSPYITRYRFITYDDEPDPEMIDRIWNDFAWPPGVTIKPIE